jgi:hypothetical protein
VVVVVFYTENTKWYIKINISKKCGGFNSLRALLSHVLLYFTFVTQSGRLLHQLGGPRVLPFSPVPLPLGKPPPQPDSVETSPGLQFLRLGLISPLPRAGQAGPVGSAGAASYCVALEERGRGPWPRFTPVFAAAWSTGRPRSAGLVSRGSFLSPQRGRPSGSSDAGQR